MSITTYTTLKSAVFNFSGRDDLSESFDTFLQMAEQFMYHNDDQPLRAQDLITTATLATVGGTNLVALPARFLSVLSIKINVGGYKYEISPTSPSALNQYGVSGVPTAFAITDTIIFDYTPDSAYDLDVIYYAQPEPLDETNNTNIILTKYPTLYLHGCLSAVSELSGEEADAENHYQKMLRGVRGAMRSSRKARLAPGGTITTRGPTP